MILELFWILNCYRSSKTAHSRDGSRGCQILAKIWHPQSCILWSKCSSSQKFIKIGLEPRQNEIWSWLKVRSKAETLYFPRDKNFWKSFCSGCSAIKFPAECDANHIWPEFRRETVTKWNVWVGEPQLVLKRLPLRYKGHIWVSGPLLT